MFTASHLSLFWGRWAQLTPSNPISLRPLSISFSHLPLDLPSDFLFAGFPHQNAVCISTLVHAYHMPRPSHSSWCRAKWHQSQMNVSQVVSVLVACHVGPEFKPLLRYRIMTKAGHTHLLICPCQFTVVWLSVIILYNFMNHEMRVSTILLLLLFNHLPQYIKALTNDHKYFK